MGSTNPTSNQVPAPFAAEVQMQSGEVQSGEVQSGAPISLVLAAIEPLRFATAAARLGLGLGLGLGSGLGSAQP